MKAEMEHEELQLVLDTIRQYAKRKLDDQTLLKLDQENRCPTELIRELLGPDVGLHLAFIPTAYGGLGGGARAIFQICEELAGVDIGLATSLLGVSLGTDPLRVGGTEAQRKRWMSQVAEKGLLVAYAVTEPSAGSDLAAIRTRAEAIEENGRIVAYRINGTKQFITNGGIADLFTILAMTPGGPSFFVVEKGTPGLEPGPSEHKHGIRSSNTTSLSLDDVVVPADQLIGGEEGQGLAQAQQVFGYTRVMVAAFGLAGGTAAIRRAIQYGAERVQDGSTLNKKAAWTHKLIVPHVVALEASRAFIEELSDRLDRGEPELQTDGAVAKLVATEAGNAAAESAIQAHGGYGYTHEYFVEKIKRDVRITCIYEGTSEILQRTITRDRWRQHLISRGAHYLDLARTMDELSQTDPDCGADQAAAACTALAHILETCRIKRLTRNQHVLFSLGELIAQTEVACAFARKAARNDPDTSRLPTSSLRVMSRLWARQVAGQVSQKGLSLIAGADVLDERELELFSKKIGLDRIRHGLRGMLADMAEAAATLTSNN
ncbi:MAG: acyl-CoA dehydrogenase family protein [Deltaproteobacteria bacterium]|nr:acyl-CoA dehydrogenase family protein [Deltaproteobacteria bacterium]